jgi:hypothetical protein
VKVPESERSGEFGKTRLDRRHKLPARKDQGGNCHEKKT